MLSAAGKPYDTLEEIIGIAGEVGNGSLKDFGISYAQADLTPEGALDLPQILAKLTDDVKLVLIQRSRGYDWRPSLDVPSINRAIDLIHEARPDVYRILDEVAAGVPAGARGLLYLPWLMGERSPVDDANLRAGLLNLSLEHAREDMVRAFLEGVALNTRWMMEAVEGFLGAPAREITLVGGGGQSDVWSQIFADILGITVHQPHQPIQANARGAAFLAGVGIGAMNFSDIPARVALRRSFEPSSSNRQRYADSYATFRAAHKALAPFYAKLHGARA